MKLRRLKRWHWWRSLVWLLDRTLPKKADRCVFLSTPDFSDNPRVFYEYLKNNSSYECVWLWRNAEDKHIPGIHFDSLKAGWILLTSKYIVVSHVTNIFQKGISSKKHILMALWHGMPLKTLGCNEHNIDKYTLSLYNSFSDGAFFVSSDIFGLSMLSCFRGDYHKVHITGTPRTDLLFSNDPKLEKIVGPIDGPVILYTPTWKEKVFRKTKEITSDFTNIFYMNDYDAEKFNAFLEKYKITFILKPHPFDEDFYKENYSAESSRIKVVYSSDFAEICTHPYEIFKETDLMISDFSSIVVDYAITRKPIIILDALTEEYSENRGFILKDNFKIFTPGNRVQNFAQLLNAIEAGLNTKECSYKDILPFLHKYPDGDACKRIAEVMKTL